MKTRRRRNRAGVAQNPDPGHDITGSEEVVEDELPSVEEIGEVNQENGVESHLEQDGAALASGNGVDSEVENVIADNDGDSAVGDVTTSTIDNGVDDVDGSGNGSTPGATHTVVNLPRRR